jgi:hypothetical protein
LPCSWKCNKVSADDEPVRRLVARFEEPERVWACHEAGPTGYELARVLRAAGMPPARGLTYCSEVCDWRRWPTAGMFMGFTGAVPSEDSSGDRTRRGGITHAGNTHLRTQLVESAWAYKSQPKVGATLRRRHEGLDPEVVARAWAAQLRLCGKFRSESMVAPALARACRLASSPSTSSPSPEQLTITAHRVATVIAAMRRIGDEGSTRLRVGERPFGRRFSLFPLLVVTTQRVVAYPRRWHRWCRVTRRPSWFLPKSAWAT